MEERGGRGGGGHSRVGGQEGKTEAEMSVMKVEEGRKGQILYWAKTQGVS